MKTLAEHERAILNAARSRAEAINQRQREAERMAAQQSQFDRSQARLRRVEADIKALGDAQRSPFYQHLLKEMQFRLAVGVEPRLREKAISVARDLLDKAQVELRPMAPFGGDNLLCELEMVVAFMEPKTYHLRRKIAK